VVAAVAAAEASGVAVEVTRRRVGLVIVTGCAIVLSFSGLYELAILCAFPWMLAALVPVLADAGAGLAADVWLDASVAKPVQRYACFIALSLISASVLGNATAHLLAFLGIAPPWWVVVLVGSLAPAVVAANLHLYALVRNGGGRAGGALAPVLIGMPGFRFTDRSPVAEVAGGEPPVAELDVQPRRLALAGERLDAAGGVDSTCADDDYGEAVEDADLMEKARELVATGAGRPALVKLGLKEHQARQLIRQHRGEATG
jgi:hypothetical protein